MQKFLIIFLAAFLLPFFVSAQPVVTSATRVKLFKGDSIFTAPLSGLASAIGGGNRPDSAWAKGTLSAPVFWGKGLTDNLFKTGNVSVGDSVISGARIGIKVNNVSATKGIELSYNNADVGFNFLKLNPVGQVNNPNLQAFNFWATNFPDINLPTSTRGNHVWRFGYNTGAAGGRILTTDADLHVAFESNFYNFQLNGVKKRVFEWHLQSQDTLGGVHRVISAQGSHDGALGDIGFCSDGLYISRYNAPANNWLQANRFLKSFAFRDSMSIFFDKNGTGGGVFQRNSTNTAYLTLMYADDQNRIVNGGSGVSSVYMPAGKLDIAGTGEIYNTAGNVINLGVSSAKSTVYVYGSGNHALRLKTNSGGANNWDTYINASSIVWAKPSGAAYMEIYDNAPYTLWANGKVGINGTAQSLFGVVQANNSIGAGLSLTNSDYSHSWYNDLSADGILRWANSGGALRMSLNQSGTLALGAPGSTKQFFALNTTPSFAANPGDIALSDNSGSGELYGKYSGTGSSGWGEFLNLIDPNGASSGQVLKWNGSAWAPGTDNTAGGVPSGTSTQTLRYDATNTLVATSQITNDGSTVGIGTAPNASYELDVAGKTRAQGLRAEGTTMQPTLELVNTTPTTGKTFTLGSGNTGNFYISSDVAGDAIAVAHATGDVTITPKLKINTYGTTATALLGRNAGSEVSEVTLGNGLSLTSGTLSATGGSVNVIRPTSLTSDQDNYAPTGWATANKVLISGDATGRAITSFSASGITDGHTKTIVNNGDNYIYFPGEHPDGTASNRIDYTRDFILTPKSAVDIMYDATDARWMITSPNYNTNRDKQLTYTVQPGSVTAGDWGQVAFGTVNVGSVNQATPISGVPGTIRLNTSTASTGGAFVGFAKAQTLVTRYGDAHLDLSADVSIPTLSDASNPFWACLQFCTDQTTATFPNVHQVGIRYKHNVNGGKWEGYTRANTSAETGVDLGVTVAANTLYSIRIVVDEARTEARFYIDNVYRGRIAAAGNEFPAAATAVTTRALCFKESGSTARSMDVAKMELTITY